MTARGTYRLKFIVFATILACIMNAAKAESHSKQTTSSDHFLDEIQQLAQNGDISAQRKLGLMYLTGQAVESNLERARHWLEKAASKNDLEAQKSLGRIYAEGLGVKNRFEQIVVNFLNSPRPKVMQLQKHF